MLLFCSLPHFILHSLLKRERKACCVSCKLCSRLALFYVNSVTCLQDHNLHDYNASLACSLPESSPLLADVQKRDGQGGEPFSKGPVWYASGTFGFEKLVTHLRTVSGCVRLCAVSFETSYDGRFYVPVTACASKTAWHRNHIPCNICPTWAKFGCA